MLDKKFITSNNLEKKDYMTILFVANWDGCNAGCNTNKNQRGCSRHTVDEDRVVATI